MKAIALFFLALIAFACADFSKIERSAEELKRNEPRSFDNPSNNYELNTKNTLLQTGATYKVASTARFSTNQWSFFNSLDHLVEGIFTNSFTITQEGEFNTQAFAYLNVAAALLAHNPVTHHIARRFVFPTFSGLFTNYFYLGYTASNHSAYCASNRVVFNGTGYCRSTVNQNTNSGFYMSVDVSDQDFVGNTGPAIQSFVYRLIDAFADFQGANVTDPLTGTNDRTTAINSYRSCYNKLWETVSAVATPSLPTFTYGINDAPANCPVTFASKGHQYCYNNPGASSYSYQQDVTALYKCGNKTEASGPATTCQPSCSQDGFCGVGDKCGYIQCVLDQDYCDYSGCFLAQSDSSNTRYCCSLSDDGVSYSHCPDTSDPKYKLCVAKAGVDYCCTDASGSDCKTAAIAKVGSCFIATAAFGDSMNPNVWALRTFRDNVLSTSAFGRAFIQFYYTVSPQIAQVISQSQFLQAVTRAFLAPVVSFVSMF